MGANAQIAVPVFTAGQVLTAAQVTQINTGIPVFATTTTRDAAFGGTGEKTLAQGQYAYIEATGQTLVYTGSAWVVLGTVLQVKNAEYSTQATSTTTTYADSGLTLAITPSSTSSKVLVQISQSFGRDDGNSLNSVGMKLFRGATDLGVFATRAGFTNSAIYQSGTIAYNYLDSPATTSATTYKTQFNNALVAAANAYTQYVSAKSTITLTEIAG
jgi:hypothetical protein